MEVNEEEKHFIIPGKGNDNLHTVIKIDSSEEEK